MAKIVWTLNAVKCLEDIHNYIFEKNQSAAQKVVDGIYNKIQLLEAFPLIGQFYRSEEDGEIRTLIYGNYKVAYQIKANDAVAILGVFHGAMEIEKHLKLEDK